MSYNNSDKPLPCTEYSLKCISWHLKVISDSLSKLIEMKINEDQNAQNNNYQSKLINNEQLPF